MKIIQWREFMGTNEVGESPYRAATCRTIRASMMRDGLEYAVEAVVDQPTDQRIKDVRAALEEMLLRVP